MRTDYKTIGLTILLAIVTCVGTAFAILSRYVSNETFTVYQDGKKEEILTLHSDIKEIKEDVKEIKRDINALVRERKS